MIVLEPDRVGVANKEPGLGALRPIPTVWHNGAVNNAFRCTVTVDVDEDDRLCIPEDVAPPWNRADEYRLEGEEVHGEMTGEAWTDDERLAKTSVGCPPFI